MPSTASQATLILSCISYLAACHAALPRRPTSTRFTQTREAFSAFHCTFVTALSILLLYHRRSDWLLPPGSPPNQKLTSDISIVTARSEAANALTALETGYLLADAGILVHGARLAARERGTSVLRQLNLRVLGWHHGGLIGAFGLMQWYIAKGREKAMLVVVMLLLMNASTPFGVLHWYLVKFRTGQKKMVMGSYAMYLATYAVFRVYLLYWILEAFGTHIGCTAMETFKQLRLSCQIGTATIGLNNVIWLLRGIRRFSILHVLEGSAKKGV